MKSQPFFEKFFHPKRTSPIFLSEKSFLRTRFLSIFRKNIKITSKLRTLFQKAYSLSARLFLQFFSFSSPLAPPKPSGKRIFEKSDVRRSSFCSKARSLTFVLKIFFIFNIAPFQEGFAMFRFSPPNHIITLSRTRITFRKNVHNREKKDSGGFFMLWLGILIGFVLGGNMGVICMALFKINKN